MSYVRNKIGEILSIELANQLALINARLLTETNEAIIADLELYKASIPKYVFVDRFLDVTENEIPYLNVTFIKNPQDYLITNSSINGEVKYIVESWQQSKTVGDIRGDQYSCFKLERLLSACSKILSSNQYKNLGLENPLIGYLNVVNVEVGEPKTDADNSKNQIYGRLTVVVKVHEEVLSGTGYLIEGNYTTFNGMFTIDTFEESYAQFNSGAQVFYNDGNIANFN